MSLILPSGSAPRTSASPASSAPARSDAPAEDSAGSFGAALSRSLEPAGEIAAKGKDKTVPVKRQADKPKTGMEDLINAMAMGLVPLPGALVKTALNGHDAAATAGAATAAAPANGPAAAAAVNTDTALQTTLASAAGETSETSAKGAKTSGPGALTAAADSAVIALAPSAVAGQHAATESGFGGQPDKRDNRDAIDLTGMRAANDASVDLKAVQAHGASKIPPNLSNPASETAAITVVGAQASQEEAIGPDAALPAAALLAPLPGAGVLAGAAAPEAASTAALAPDVGSSEWGKALGQQVVHMGKAGQQVAELQLNPPGLGPLKVTLSLNDQQMQASFVSAHASVRLAIESALPQLRSTLADSGISLGNTSVSSESQQQQQTFADRPGEQASQRSYRAINAPDTPALAARLVAPQVRLSASSVDTYA